VGRVRNVIGTTADLIQIGTFVVFVMGGLALALVFWIKAGAVAAWIFAVVVAGLVLVVILSFVIGRKTRALAPAAGEAARAEAELRSSQEQNEAVKRLLYDVIESIQQELAAEAAWQLDQVVERGVLGPLRGLLIRQADEDVRLSVVVPRDDPPTRWRMRWAAGHRPESVRLFDRAIDETLSGRAFRTNEFVVSHDVTADAAFRPNPLATRPFRSLVSAPVRCGDRTVGTFTVVSTHSNAFSVEDISVIKVVGAVIDLLVALEEDAARS
jgi:GAF domain-containing protein